MKFANQIRSNDLTLLTAHGLYDTLAHLKQCTFIPDHLFGQTVRLQEPLAFV